MRKHFRIFLSSTFSDLRDSREKIIEYIQSQKDIVLCMEDFNADDRTAQSYIENEIEYCDAFILVIGQTEGSLNSEGRFFVEAEIAKAAECNKPIFIFRPSTETAATKKFYAFMADNGIGPLARYYSLSSETSDLFANFTKSYPSIRERLNSNPSLGLVSASVLEGAFQYEGFNTSIRNLPELSEATVKFSQAWKLVDRGREFYHQKRAAAFAAFRTFGKRLFEGEGRRDIYFDGGASAIVASSELMKLLQRYFLNGKKVFLHTNSPQTQISILMNKDNSLGKIIGPNLFPIHGYYDVYGTYLGAAMQFPEPNEDFWVNEYYEDKDYGNLEIVQEFKNYYAGKKPIIVTSVSGYDISEKKALNGPWVRSVPNYYYKRGLFDTEFPIVMMLDSGKWDRDAERNKSVCVLSLMQRNELGKVPLCIAAAFSHNAEISSFREYFSRQHNFKLSRVDEYQEQGVKSYSCLAYTKAFEEHI